jgi:hypothetical protein
MVQEVLVITPAIRDGGNKGVIRAAFTLQKVPIFEEGVQEGVQPDLVTYVSVLDVSASVNVFETMDDVL